VKTTTHTLRKLKNQRPIVAVTAYDAITARYASAAGVDLILIGDSVGNTLLGFENTVPVTLDMICHHTAAVARAKPDSLIAADVPFAEAHYDFERILVSTDASQVKQYQALLGTEGVTVEFAPEAIRRLAEIAFQVNERTENIGARRLHTVMERLLENVSYEATEQTHSTVTIDARYVDEHLGNLVKDEDLSRYIL